MCIFKRYEGEIKFKGKKKTSTPFSLVTVNLNVLFKPQSCDYKLIFTFSL